MRAHTHTHIYIYITSYLFVLMLEIFWWLPLQEKLQSEFLPVLYRPYMMRSHLCPHPHLLPRCPSLAKIQPQCPLRCPSNTPSLFPFHSLLCSFYLNPLLLAILSQLKHHILRVAFSNHPDQLLSTPSSYMLQSHQI